LPGNEVIEAGFCHTEPGLLITVKHALLIEQFFKGGALGIGFR